MNIQDVSTQLLYTTFPIVSREETGVTIGTGFIFSIKKDEHTLIPLLITNYHVLEKTKGGFMEFHIGENGNPTNKTIQINFGSEIISKNKLGPLDLIAIPFAGTIEELNRRGIELFYRTVDQTLIPSKEIIDDFAAIEDVTFVGYPSGLYDNKNKFPIIRQGITATPIWNNYEGDEVFLIDAGVFQGSSGSPVFIYNRGAYPTKDGFGIGNRLFFVGVISQTMYSGATTNRNYLDLGVVINGSAAYHEIQRYITSLEQNS